MRVEGWWIHVPSSHPLDGQFWGAFWMFLEGSASRTLLAYSSDLGNVPFCGQFLLHCLTLPAFSLLFPGTIFQKKIPAPEDLVLGSAFGRIQTKTACNSDLKILNTIYIMFNIVYIHTFYTGVGKNVYT